MIKLYSRLKKRGSDATKSFLAAIVKREADDIVAIRLTRAAVPGDQGTKVFATELLEQQRRRWLDGSNSAEYVFTSLKIKETFTSETLEVLDNFIKAYNEGHSVPVDLFQFLREMLGEEVSMTFLVRALVKSLDGDWVLNL